MKHFYEFACSGCSVSFLESVDGFEELFGLASYFLRQDKSLFVYSKLRWVVNYNLLHDQSAMVKAKIVLKGLRL